MFKTAEELVSWIEKQRRLTPKTSLDRFKTVCALFGNPQEGRKYIHVGGTNGKGSTVSFIKNALREAGYNVGVFTSPYVLAFNERISLNGEFIPDSELLEIGNHILSKYSLLEDAGIEPLSFFEFVTLIAFLYFSKKQPDFVILEVGLGGLLDCTNIITPLVSVITNVSYDHMNVLGDTLAEIARNKLGIVKPGVPLIAGFVTEVADLYVKTCEEKRSPLLFVREEEIRNLRVSLEETAFAYKDYGDVKLRLLGGHQAQNAALAIEALRELMKTYPITKEQVLKGLAETEWPGRLQVLSRRPLILVDGAHNPGGIAVLVRFLKEVKGGRFLRVVFAVSHDKAKEKMLPLIEEVADEMVFSRYSYKRSDDARLLYELSKHPRKRVEEDLDVLLEEAKNSPDVMTVFCGSLYFVSDVLHKFPSSS